MSGFEIIIIVAVIMLLFGSGALLIFKSTRSSDSRHFDDLSTRVDQFERNLARNENAMRDEFARSREENARSTRENREELAGSFKNLGDSLIKSLSEMAGLQKAQLETFSSQLAKLTQSNEEKTEKLIATLEEKFTQLQQQAALSEKGSREELVLSLHRFSEQFSENVKAFNETQKEKFDKMREGQTDLTTSTEIKLEKMRETVETKLSKIQEENGQKLDQMRATVDEKLQKTLDTRLGQSFEIVSRQLENVQKGLGEMQTLAADVGGLKKVLSNVKIRGGIGEVQLEMLLEQILAPEQFEANVRVLPGSSDIVEFAVKLPGREDSQQVIYLPIDAKFPKDAYEQFIEAFETGDPVLADVASKNLDTTLRRMAKDIREKYIHPPYTTDFAILFLPFESIYAEVVRRSALMETLQRDFKIIVTGPTTLAAILNSLQMGFRTLAIQKRSSEVWDILRAVKNEFEKFGGILQKAKNNLESASNQLDEVMGRRTRAITRTLKKVEGLPEAGTDLSAPGLLESGEDEESDEAS